MLSPYLFYQDTCEAAFNYYAKVLGGKIDAMMRSSDAPPDVPAAPGREKMIMHARMSLPDGSVLMASDVPAEHFHKPQGFSISLTVKDPADGERKFNALADGGSVTNTVLPGASTAVTSSAVAGSSVATSLAVLGNGGN